jgi:thiol:disulfide interchange protein DsbA
MVSNYKIDSTPSFVVDGRYLTSPSTVGTANPALERQLPEATKSTLDALVAKAMKEKGYEAAPAAKPASKPAAKTAAK